MAYEVNLKERTVTITLTFQYDEESLNEILRENAEDNEQVPRNLTEEELGDLLDEMGDMFSDHFAYSLDEMYSNGIDRQRQIEFFDNLDLEEVEA